MTGRFFERCSAAATESVVLPTPPLPPNSSTRRDTSESTASANGARRTANSFPVAGVDADAALVLFLLVGHLARHLFPPGADVAQRGEDLRFFARELLLA